MLIVKMLATILDPGLCAGTLSNVLGHLWFIQPYEADAYIHILQLRELSLGGKEWFAQSLLQKQQNQNSK